MRRWRWPWERGGREEPASQPASEASKSVVPTEDPDPVITERPNSGGTGGGPVAVMGWWMGWCRRSTRSAPVSQMIDQKSAK